MISDGKTTKTKFVDLDKNYNFIVVDFFIWNYLWSQHYIQVLIILKFKFFQTTSDGETTKIKIGLLVDIYNFLVEPFFI
jgi:hypothetical protein